MSTVLKSKRKRLKGAHHALYLAMLLSILLPVLLSNLSFSQVSGYAYCSGLFQPSGNSGNAYSIFSYPTSLNNMLSLSLLAIAVMLLIVGMLYAIGFAFKIDKLIRFSKGEIGEIIITVLIVLVLIGTFSISSRVTPSSPPVSPITGTSLFSDSQFMSACTEAANVSIGLLPAAISFTVQGSILSFLQSLTISIEPNFFGIAFSPLAGVSLITKVVGMLTDIAWGFVLLMAGVALFLFIIFAFFPIFLFVGVVLRTIPWTRAAGGAFLGIFIGFFLVLPALLSFTLNIGAISIFSGIGEAPQLSPTYAQYDNGASVFNFYDNFAGTSLNTSKWSETINGGITITVNNGLTMTQTGGSYNDQGIIGKTAISMPAIIESYGMIPQDQNTGYDMTAFGFLNSLTYTVLYVAIGTANTGTGTIYVNPEGKWSSSDGTATNYNSNARSNHVWSVWYNGATITSQMDYSNTYTNSYSSTTTVYPAFYLESNGNTGYTSYWVRVRAYPPNGVMPSISFTKAVQANICTITLGTSAINFGTINAGSNIATSNAITDTNSGNANAYMFVYGGNWINWIGPAQFGVSNTTWSKSSGTTFATANKLLSTPFNTTLVVPASGSNTIYFGIGVPGGAPSGAYSQTITIENSC